MTTFLWVYIAFSVFNILMTVAGNADRGVAAYTVLVGGSMLIWAALLLAGAIK